MNHFTPKNELLSMLEVENVNLRDSLLNFENLTIEGEKDLLEIEDTHIDYLLCNSKNEETIRGIYNRLEYNDDRDSCIRRLSSNSFCPADILAVFSTSPDNEVRAHVAGNKNTDSTILEKLSIDESELVRCHVASNPNVSEFILGRLLYDDSKFVRSGVAINENISSSTIKRLVKDIDVATFVLQNKKISTGILDIIFKNLSELDCINHEIYYAYNLIAAHENTSGSTLDVLVDIVVNKDTSVYQEIQSIYNFPLRVEILKVAAAKNHNTYPITLKKLSKDLSASVRRAVLYNPNITSEIVFELAYDTEPDISKKARENPKFDLTQFVEEFIN